MSNEFSGFNDQRGLLFTIDREPDPVYQVESRRWARPENRWPEGEIPAEIRAKVAELKQSGLPGAFARLLPGDEGVYVLYEKNVKQLPELAAADISVDPARQPAGARQLAPYDIVICARAGAVPTGSGEELTTADDEYYVVKCGAWTRFALEQAMRPAFVETTKDFLHLLEDLHGKNFFSMSPDRAGEALPPDLEPPSPAIVAINCYVLNLSRFKR